MKKLYYEEISNVDGGDNDDFLMIQDGEWIDEGKFQSKVCIVLHLPDKKFYEYSISKSGSYFTDFEYENDGMYEVYPVTKSISYTEWKQVK